MISDQCKKVGKVLKTHGREGELIISSDLKLPDKFVKEESIFIQADGLLVPFFIERAFLKTSYTAVIKLEDINSIEDADELTSSDWYVTKKQWERLFEEEISDYSFLDQFMVYDQNDERIGQVTGILEIPSNTLLEVNYKDRTIEVPINDETLLHVDADKEIIKITIPEGLLDL